MFEIAGVPEETAREALRLAMNKLPNKTKFVARETEKVGENDEDKDTANFMKNTLGISPYSIKIGNKSFTYDWAQPVAAPFAIMADLEAKENEDATLIEKAIDSFNTGFNIVIEQSFMQSIKTVLDNNDGIASGIQ